MRSIPLLIHADRLEITDYWSKVIKQAVTDAGGPIRGEIVPHTPESRNARKYLMGGLIPLWIYLDGSDYRDSTICDFYFEQAKREFSPQVLKINGKIQLFGKSSKGRKQLLFLISSVQDYLVDNYGISYDNKAMSNEIYKEWRDVLLTSEYPDFISYCVAMNFIK